MTEMQQAIERAREYIAATEKNIETLNNLQSLDWRGVHRAHVSSTGFGVYVTTIYDMATYRHNRQVLLAAGWAARDGSAFVTNDGWRYIELENDDCILTYIMKPELDGSTCTREKIGERIESVYKVSC